MGAKARFTLQLTEGALGQLGAFEGFAMAFAEAANALIRVFSFGPCGRGMRLLENRGGPVSVGTGFPVWAGSKKGFPSRAGFQGSPLAAGRQKTGQSQGLGGEGW